jgi:hypothetical protein
LYNGTKQFLLPRTDADRLGGAADAINNCKKYNTTAVSIHSDRENDFFAKWIGAHTVNVWLGAQQMQNGEWRWTDGSPFDFTHWDSNKYPLKDGIKCIYTTPRASGSWFNGYEGVFSHKILGNCTDKMTIVCQRKIN